MIGSLRGTVAARSPGGCVLDVGGVGYRVACSTSTLAALPSEGQQAMLLTHLHVRDDVLALYGFATEEERSLFEALTSVSGVGPRVALQVCSAFDAESFRRVLLSGDAEAIASVPGLGKKTAHRIVLELKERLSPQGAGAAPGVDAVSKARSALENLGYSPAEVRAALSGLTASSDDRVEDVVRSALKVLAS